MTDIIGQASEYLPDISIAGAGNVIINIITWFILTLIGGIIAGIIVYVILRRKKFNKKIVIFEKIAGKFEPSRRDRAMLMNFGRTGDTILYLSKHKKYLPTPTIQTGRNTYWYAVREDGEWINIGIEDIDMKMRQLNAHFLDKEMRYARVSLQKNLKERYDAPTFLQKYGGVIAFTLLVVLFGIMSWLLFDKFLDVSGELQRAISLANEILKETNRQLGILSNIKTGSGIVPA